ncbi:MAG: ABC transporter ATP-binding protein [Propioniciclava sp.]
MTTATEDRSLSELVEAEGVSRDEELNAKAALADIISPVRGLLMVGRLLGVLSGVLAVVPYVVLVQLGAILLSAAAGGTLPDAGAVHGSLSLLIGSFIARIFVYFVALLCTHIADVKLNRSVRERMMRSLGRAPLSWFSERASGLVRKTLQDDVTALHVLVAHKPVDNAVAITMPIALLVYAFAINWRLGLIAIVVPLIYIVFYALMMRGMGSMMLELDHKLERLSATAIEFIAGINVVKAFGTVGKAHRRFSDQASATSGFYYEWVKPMLRVSSIGAAIISGPVLLLVVFGGGAWLVSVGLAEPAQVVAISLISLMLPGAMDTLGNQSWGQQTASAAAVRISALIHCDHLEAPRTSRTTPENNTVTLDKVGFSYGDVQALDNVSLTFAEGTTTALVGPSGSGKSTLATLVARFHDPDVGMVRIGGADVRDLSEDDLYARVSFVLQRPELLVAGVAENIALARPEATLDEIRRAAQAAQIDADIEALPFGYDTVLGRDTQLSGGQEQRIAIARAVLADRPILLLDEATAMTDPDCEADIQRALSRLVVGKTVIVIAHRPASIRGVDSIVVLDGGKVIAQGTHEELAEQPHYQAIWRATTDTVKEQA